MRAIFAVGLSRGMIGLVATLPWLFSGGFVTTSRGQEPVSWSSGQWRTWRDGQIKKILGARVNGENILARHEVIKSCCQAYSFITPFLSDPKFLADPERSKLLRNFVKFVTAEHRLEIKDTSGNLKFELGMDVTDRDYWSYVSPHVRFPDLLKSQAFLEAMSHPELYESAVHMIEAENAHLAPDRKWVVYPFRAQFILSVDETTYGRLLVLIPNEPTPDGQLLDRWILFAISTPDLKPVPEVRSVSMISVVHGRIPSGSHKAYLADFMRNKDPETGRFKIEPNFLMKPNPSKICYDCHKTSVIPVHPKFGYAFGSEGQLVSSEVGEVPARVNQLIGKYGRADFGHLDPNSYGPTLGQAGNALTDEFIDKATNDSPVSRSSYPRLRAALNCSKCHDQFAKINYLLAVRSDRDARTFESKKGLVQSVIENGWMPPGSKLNTSERHALWECAMKSYLDPKAGRGDFVTWLKGD